MTRRSRNIIQDKPQRHRRCLQYSQRHQKVKIIFLQNATPFQASASCGTLMGCRVFQFLVSHTFALSRAFPPRPTTWPFQARARDRGRRRDDVAICRKELMVRRVSGVITIIHSRKSDRGFSAPHWSAMIVISSGVSFMSCASQSSILLLIPPIW